MFSLVVRFEVLPDQMEAFDALVAETLVGIAAHEPGTVVYVSHANTARPTERIFYECYQNEGAFVCHEEGEHTRRFLAERGRYLAGEPEVWRLVSTAGVIAGHASGPDAG